MRLLGNRLLARRVKRPTQTNSPIVLPEIVQDDDNTGGPKEWLVLDVGPGRRNRQGEIVPVECSAGDRVVCHSYTTGAHDVGDGTFILSEDMIMFVIPKEA